MEIGSLTTNIAKEIVKECKIAGTIIEENVAYNFVRKPPTKYLHKTPISPAGEAPAAGPEMGHNRESHPLRHPANRQILRGDAEIRARPRPDHPENAGVLLLLVLTGRSDRRGEQRQPLHPPETLGARDPEVAQHLRRPRLQQVLQEGRVFRDAPVRPGESRCSIRKTSSINHVMFFSYLLIPPNP